MKKILNIAGYKFIQLTQLPALRDQLKINCNALRLKGTILLSSEGANITLAGTVKNTNEFIERLAQNPKFADIQYKKSYSDFVPFKRLLIKIKKEIITFAISGVNPTTLTGTRIAPQEFKRWLDENKDIAVLDVRNDCEIQAGTFAKAINLKINNFRSFPQAVKKLAPELKQKPLVMFCTGGIRCEKASAYLLQQGFSEIYQLDGGILQYFAECGQAHYEGKCFVFDARGALDERLE